jgi:ABC-type Fe3+ transport system permease subunit
MKNYLGIIGVIWLIFSVIAWSTGSIPYSIEGLIIANVAFLLNHAVRIIKS